MINEKLFIIIAVVIVAAAILWMRPWANPEGGDKHEYS